MLQHDWLEIQKSLFNLMNNYKRSLGTSSSFTVSSDITNIVARQIHQNYRILIDFLAEIGFKTVFTGSSTVLYFPSRNNKDCFITIKLRGNLLDLEFSGIDGIKDQISIFKEIHPEILEVLSGFSLITAYLEAFTERYKLDIPITRTDFETLQLNLAFKGGQR